MTGFHSNISFVSLIPLCSLYPVWHYYWDDFFFHLLKMILILRIFTRTFKYDFQIKIARWHFTFRQMTGFHSNISFVSLIPLCSLLSMTLTRRFSYWRRYWYARFQMISKWRLLDDISHFDDWLPFKYFLRQLDSILLLVSSDIIHRTISSSAFEDDSHIEDDIDIRTL